VAHLEVFEGTWEELATHAETFKGRKLRLVDRIEREPGPPSSDPYQAAFGEIIAEKHRKMGLQL
jgi:hypothetical protein